MSDTISDEASGGAVPDSTPEKKSVRKTSSTKRATRAQKSQNSNSTLFEINSSLRSEETSSQSNTPVGLGEDSTTPPPPKTVRKRRTSKQVPTTKDVAVEATEEKSEPTESSENISVAPKPVRKRIVRTVRTVRSKKLASPSPGKNQETERTTATSPIENQTPVSEETGEQPQTILVKEEPLLTQETNNILAKGDGETSSEIANSVQQPVQQKTKQRGYFNNNKKVRFVRTGDKRFSMAKKRDVRTKKLEQTESAEPAAPIELGPPEEVEGILEITTKGFGFLRTQESGFEQERNAVYVPFEMIKTHGLRHAVEIRGKACRHARGIQLTEITTVNGVDWQTAKLFPHFEELKAVNPSKRIIFETAPERFTTRTLDLVAPIARGQRGLIVAPPRTGKTTFLQHMAEAIRANYEDTIHLMILLIDERPEEVTEFQRSIKGAEIYASSNDGRVRDHCRLAELCIERAKRLVETGKHVFILMDSITRLARAYNNVDKGSGRTMSGGIDARALEMPRRLFAAARNTRQAGSLTIIATALVETNSRMDELIFQEFKGTGNMELVLSRRIAEQYIFPAVDILKSGTRREELILPANWLYKIHLIRRALAGLKPVEAMERLLFFLKKYPSNAQMLIDLKQRA